MTDIGEPGLVRASSIEIARGAVLAGRYQIEAAIGKGGSGIVLRAFDRVAQVPVAIKILKPELATDPRWIERFSRELRLGRQIQHPNVCRVFDIGQADGHWFITMELATCGTLRDHLGDRAGDRSTDEKVADVRAVVAGLAAIHEAGIVHRDVKPDNFLRMADGRLVLSDFGLATNPADAPAVSILVGTPYYMAPEVVMGEPASQASDVWAAGIVIHEILFGSRPERTSPTRVKVAPTSEDAKGLEAALLRVVRPCLAEDHADRPEGGAALLRAVDDALAGTERSRPLGARARRGVWGVIALATVALLAVLGKRLWQPASASWARRSGVATVTTTGTPRDWSLDARPLAEIKGRVHCFSLLPRSETARVVWGTPRRAEDIDLTTGARVPSPLRPETFATDCPQLSPDGHRLLFTRQAPDTLPQIMLSDLEDTNEGVTNSRMTSSRILTNGIEPLWMPSGEEFLFNLDVSHAGVFSIPTMSYNILNDDRGQSTRTLYKKAISPQGDLLAIVYNSDNVSHRVFELHSVPDLNVLSIWNVPFSVHDVSFDARGLYLSDIDGGVLERLDWRTGRAERIGKVPGKTLRSVTTLASGASVTLSRTQHDDAWLFDPGEPPRQLTDDGKTYSGSWSPRGDILLGKNLEDGRFVIELRERTGTSRQVTNGPADSLPSFSPDGATWVYAAYDRKTIVRCEGATCADLLHTQQLPIWPVLAPESHAIAFVTAYGTPRLHVANAKGAGEHDIGPTAIECPPVWTGPRTLWAFSGAGSDREWLEIDSVTGTRTGRSKPATAFNADDRECGWGAEPPTSPFYQHVRIIPQETSDLASQPTRPNGFN